MIPENHLIQDIVFGLVMSGHIKEQLFSVPIEDWREVGVQIE